MGSSSSKKELYKVYLSGGSSKGDSSARKHSHSSSIQRENSVGVRSGGAAARSPSANNVSAMFNPNISFNLSTYANNPNICPSPSTPGGRSGRSTPSAGLRRKSRPKSTFYAQCKEEFLRAKEAAMLKDELNVISHSHEALPLNFFTKEGEAEASRVLDQVSTSMSMGNIRPKLSARDSHPFYRKNPQAEFYLTEMESLSKSSNPHGHNRSRMLDEKVFDPNKSLLSPRIRNSNEKSQIIDGIESAENVNTSLLLRNRSMSPGARLTISKKQNSTAFSANSSMEWISRSNELKMRRAHLENKIFIQQQEKKIKKMAASAEDEITEAEANKIITDSNIFSRRSYDELTNQLDAILQSRSNSKEASLEEFLGGSNSKREESPSEDRTHQFSNMLPSPVQGDASEFVLSKFSTKNTAPQPTIASASVFSPDLTNSVSVAQQNSEMSRGVATVQNSEMRGSDHDEVLRGSVDSNSSFKRLLANERTVVNDGSEPAPKPPQLNTFVDDPEIEFFLRSMEKGAKAGSSSIDTNSKNEPKQIIDKEKDAVTPGAAGQGGEGHLTNNNTHLYEDEEDNDDSFLDGGRTREHSESIAQHFGGGSFEKLSANARRKAQKQIDNQWRNATLEGKPLHAYHPQKPNSGAWGPSLVNLHQHIYPEQRITQFKDSVFDQVTHAAPKVPLSRNFFERHQRKMEEFKREHALR